MGKFRRQSFQGDLNTRRFIEALVNHTHAALTELGKDLITPHNEGTDFKASVIFPFPQRHNRFFCFELKFFQKSMLPP